MTQRATRRRSAAEVLREMSRDRETSAYVERISMMYPNGSAQEARRLIDKAMGKRTLTGELYKMRNEEAM